MSESIMFDRYDDEFQNLIKQVEASLRSVPESGYSESILQQCDDLIKQMALEARSVHDNALKRRLLEKVRDYKGQYQSLQAEVDRAGLLGNHSELSAGRERLLKNEDSLNQQNETLERARRTMEETEAVALEITTELGQNREKLASAHGRIREVSGLTGRARRILVSMNQRATQQKLILYGVAVGLVLGFLIMLWTMWR